MAPAQSRTGHWNLGFQKESGTFRFEHKHLTIYQGTSRTTLTHTDTTRSHYQVAGGVDPCCRAAAILHAHYTFSSRINTIPRKTVCRLRLSTKSTTVKHGSAHGKANIILKGPVSAAIVRKKNKHLKHKHFIPSGRVKHCDDLGPQ